MRFLIDAQLPPRLVQFFVQRGCRAEHVADALTLTAPDRAIVDWASRNAVVIVSKDADFVVLLDGRVDVQLLRLKIGNASTPALFAKLDEAWTDIERRLLAGEAVVEVD